MRPLRKVRILRAVQSGAAGRIEGDEWADLDAGGPPGGLHEGGPDPLCPKEAAAAGALTVLGEAMDRDEAIRRIRAALKARSGKTWSVRGGRGTAWGWIDIDVPPAREDAREQELLELAKLMNLEKIHSQGLAIPASRDHYQEAVDRAEGCEPSVIGQPYWD